MRFVCKMLELNHGKFLYFYFSFVLLFIPFLSCLSAILLLFFPSIKAHLTYIHSCRLYTDRQRHASQCARHLHASNECRRQLPHACVLQASGGLARLSSRVPLRGAAHPLDRKRQLGRPVSTTPAPHARGAACNGNGQGRWVVGDLNNNDIYSLIFLFLLLFFSFS